MLNQMAELERVPGLPAPVRSADEWIEERRGRCDRCLDRLGDYLAGAPPRTHTPLTRGTERQEQL
jgi:hypothetical protein